MIDDERNTYARTGTHGHDCSETTVDQKAAENEEAGRAQGTASPQLSQQQWQYLGALPSHSAQEVAEWMTIPELQWLRRALNARGRHVHHLTWCEERLEQKGLIRRVGGVYSATVLGRQVLGVAEQAWRKDHEELHSAEKQT